MCLQRGHEQRHPNVDRTCALYFSLGFARQPSDAYIESLTVLVVDNNMPGTKVAQENMSAIIDLDTEPAQVK